MRKSHAREKKKHTKLSVIQLNCRLTWQYTPRVSIRCHITTYRTKKKTQNNNNNNGAHIAMHMCALGSFPVLLHLCHLYLSFGQFSSMTWLLNRCDSNAILSMAPKRNQTNTIPIHVPPPINSIRFKRSIRLTINIRTDNNFAQESNGGYCYAASYMPQYRRLTQSTKNPVNIFVDGFGGIRIHDVELFLPANCTRPKHTNKHTTSTD